MVTAVSAKSRVTKYCAKRDFDKTSEPNGNRVAPSSSTLRFVIQRHDARRSKNKHILIDPEELKALRTEFYACARSRTIRRRRHHRSHLLG